MQKPLLGKHLRLAAGLLFALISAGSGSAATTPSLSSQSSDLQLLCTKERMKSICLEGLLKLRCHRYAFPRIDLGEECSRAGRELLQVMDLHTHPIDVHDSRNSYHYSLTLLFRERLDTLITDPETHAYLKSLMLDLRRAGREKSPFNLWERTLDFTRGDRIRALEYVAVLLQDTSRTRVQIDYLFSRAQKERLPQAEKDAIGDLAVIQELIRDDRFREPGVSDWLSLYPVDTHLNGVLNPSPYHFYPMAFLAHLLKENGVSDSFAYFLPFLFNAEYEFQTLDPQAWPLKVPGPFKLEPRLNWQMRDIYAGLTGSLWGIQRLDVGTNPAEDFNSFTRELAKHPARAMKREFRRLPSR